MNSPIIEDARLRNSWMCEEVKNPLYECRISYETPQAGEERIEFLYPLWNGFKVSSCDKIRFPLQLQFDCISAWFRRT